MMRRAACAGLLGVALLAASAASASATITSPAIGGSVAASGSMALGAGVLSATCPSVSLVGVRSTRSGFDFLNGLPGACGPAAVSFTSFPWWGASLNLTSATFSISGVGVQLAIATPLSFICEYWGSISGTYSRGAASTLTITGDALTLRSGSSAACSTNPVISGTLTTNMTTV